MQLGISTYTYGWSFGTPGNRPALPMDEQALLDRAAQFGVRLVQFGDNLPLHELENHDRLKAWEFADIVERVNSPNVGICLDSVNSMGAGEGLEEVVRTLAPYTVNLHVKDFGIRRLPHLMGFQIDGRPAGEGMLNVPWLVGQIAPYGRCQTAILEQWVVPDDDPLATVAKEERWAEWSMNYLRKTQLFTYTS